MEWVVIIISLLIVIIDIAIFLRFGKKENKKTGNPAFFAEKTFVIGKFISRGRKVSSAVKNRRKRLLIEMYEVTEATEIAEKASYAPITYLMIFAPVIGLARVFCSNDIIVFPLFILLVFLCFYFDLWLQKEVDKRHEQIRQDYATVLTKISLLVNAGLTASDAFERVAYSGDGLLYKEMQRTTTDILNGQSFDAALSVLSRRGGCKEVKKFVSLYRQNLVKGGSEFPFLLSEMANLAWTEKKNRARLAGSIASQKLLLPIMLMFSGVILMVIVPAFNSLL